VRVIVWEYSVSAAECFLYGEGSFMGIWMGMYASYSHVILIFEYQF
jgi:hypothetical protein